MAPTAAPSVRRKPPVADAVRQADTPSAAYAWPPRVSEQGGLEELDRWKRAAIAELNALGIPDLKVESLTPLNGFYVNLEYRLPNGQAVKLLEDSKIYMGSQIERPGQERCYGVVADEKYLLVCEYGCNGADPKIVCYKRRQCDPA